MRQLANHVETANAGPSSAEISDDFSRHVYAILGIPIDAIEMSGALDAICQAVADAKPFVLSTPNLNYLVTSQRDAKFRETLLRSELSPADGMPIVWIARLLGLPITQRIAGADIFKALCKSQSPRQLLKVFLFGGDEGTAEAAARAINEKCCGVVCVGYIYPGFGTLEEISRNSFIDEINSSHADFLLVALGAQKGQLWLHRNRARLLVPVRAHLGATLNYTAKKFRRAPSILQRLGFEWLWRIKEEPHLWPRYRSDGIFLLRLMLTCVLPLTFWNRWQRLSATKDLTIEVTENSESVTLNVSGAALEQNVHLALPSLRKAAAAGKEIHICFSDRCSIDARFLGLLLMLRKQANERGSELIFRKVPKQLRRMFYLNGVGFLISPELQ